MYAAFGVLSRSHHKHYCVNDSQHSSILTEFYVLYMYFRAMLIKRQKTLAKNYAYFLASYDLQNMQKFQQAA